MKLILSTTSILLILSSSSTSTYANAGLPPGYDTFMHCPPGSCSAYISHPRGFVGPNRAFYKCYDETTEEMTEAVWTGYRTDIEAPQGWIQDPPECDSVLPKRARVTPPKKNVDKPGGLCVTDSDCYTKIRSTAPMDNEIGPQLCQCYATSSRLPFDETEGGEKGSVVRVRCTLGACDGFEPYCPLAPNDNGMAECALRPIDNSSASTLSSTFASNDSPRQYYPKRRPNTSLSASTSSSSDDSPPIKKRKPAQSSSMSTFSSDDSSTTHGIVSPTPAPPAHARANVHIMSQS